MGDFNVNYNSNSNKDLKNAMKANGFKQIVTSSIRITKDSSTIIDLIFVNKPSHYQTVKVIATSLSDHELVFCLRKINTMRFPDRTIKCRNYRSYEPTHILNDANEIDWSPIYNTNDVNKAVSYLQNALTVLFDKHAPLIEKRVRGKPCGWLDDNIKHEMNRRDGLLRRARKLNNENSWREYKNQRNRCTNLVKKAKRNFHKELLREHKFSPRRFWNAIKSIFPTKSNSSTHKSSDMKKTSE